MYKLNNIFLKEFLKLRSNLFTQNEKHSDIYILTKENSKNLALTMGYSLKDKFNLDLKFYNKIKKSKFEIDIKFLTY